MQRAAVAASMASVRRGELSTWQCEQAWLQYSPMLSCSVVASRRRSGVTPRSCATGGRVLDRCVQNLSEHASGQLPHGLLCQARSYFACSQPAV